MKVVILAGGLGTRLSEETDVRPKPMVEIGGRPLLWHIMKHYSHYGLEEFHIALGYKGDLIKRYFLDYQALYGGSISVQVAGGSVKVHDDKCEDWVVHLVETGLTTATGGRLGKLRSWLQDAPFCLTYGDGLSDLDLRELLEFHRRHKRIATLTAVRPPARFGALRFDGDLVDKFEEKPQIGEGWINGGFMVFEPRVLEHIAGDETSLERDVLEKLAGEGELAAYRHEGFWQSMDTLRDVRLLQRLWAENETPWKVWAT